MRTRHFWILPTSEQRYPSHLPFLPRMCVSLLWVSLSLFFLILILSKKYFCHCSKNRKTCSRSLACFSQCFLTLYFGMGALLDVYLVSPGYLIYFFLFNNSSLLYNVWCICCMIWSATWLPYFETRHSKEVAAGWAVVQFKYSNALNQRLILDLAIYQNQRRPWYLLQQMGQL